MHSLYYEIFGFENSASPVVRKTPMLPMDDPLYDYHDGTGAGGSLCDKLENTAFTNEILGEIQAPPLTFRPGTRPSAPETSFEIDFAKLLETGINRAADVRDRAPSFRRGISRILNQFQTCRELAPIANDPGWVDLSRACERFVSDAVLAA
jgi:hypothetical protein